MPMFLREFSSWMLRYRRTWKGTIVISVANPLLFLMPSAPGSDSWWTPRRWAASDLPGVLRPRDARRRGDAERLRRGGVRGPRLPAHGQGYLVAAATPLEPRDIMAGHMLFMAFRIGTSALAFAVVMFGLRRRPLPVGGAHRARRPADRHGLRGPAGGVDGDRRQVQHPQHGVPVRADADVPVLRDLLRASRRSPTGCARWRTSLPLWHGVDLCRTLSLGTATPLTSAIHVGYLAALTAGGVAVALTTYRRHIHV